MCRKLADLNEVACEAGHLSLVIEGDHAQAIGTRSCMSRYQNAASASG